MSKARNISTLIISSDGKVPTDRIQQVRAVDISGLLNH